MIVSALAVVLALLAGGDADSYIVQLTNGREFAVEQARQEKDYWEFTLGEGSMRVPAVDVKGVAPKREGADDDPSAPTPPPAEESATPVALEETQLCEFAVGDIEMRVRLPAGFRRAEPSPEVLVTYLSRDESESFRFARSETKDSIWALGGPIQRLHAQNYSGYRTLSERFTSFGEHSAWILLFSYQKGKKEWRECQAFIQLDGAVVMMSVTTPGDRPGRARQRVDSAGRSIEILPRAGRR